MPKNKVTDLITDQEMTYGRLILSGKMTDQQAAEAAGLNPATAAYTKSKPRVQAYMHEQRALMQQQLAEQQADSLRRFHLGREQVLERLWEIAKIGPEITRGSLTSQVKALSMIVAMEGLIPDRRAGSAEKDPAPTPTKAYIYPSAWRREQEEAEAAALQHNPDLNQEAHEAHEEDGLQAEPAPGLEADAPQDLGPIFDAGESTLPNGSGLTETEYPPYRAFPPDTRVPFSIPKNPFARRRR